MVCRYYLHLQGGIVSEFHVCFKGCGTQLWFSDIQNKPELIVLTLVSIMIDPMFVFLLGWQVVCNMHLLMDEPWWTYMGILLVERLVAVEYPKEAPSPARFLRAGVRKPMGCFLRSWWNNSWECGKSLKIMRVIMKAATSEQNETQSHNSCCSCLRDYLKLIYRHIYICFYIYR